MRKEIVIRLSGQRRRYFATKAGGPHVRDLESRLPLTHFLFALFLFSLWLMSLTARKAYSVVSISLLASFSRVLLTSRFSAESCQCRPTRRTLCTPVNIVWSLPRAPRPMCCAPFSGEGFLFPSATMLRGHRRGQAIGLRGFSRPAADTPRRSLIFDSNHPSVERSQIRW